MELRALGRTGLRVSPIGLGTVKLGRSAGVKYATPVRIPTDEEAAALIDAAEGLGVNLIDTAPAYGNSEERVGRLLRGRRERWVVCTKAGEEFDGAASTFDFSEAAVRASAERSFTRLGVSVIDIVLLHSDERDEWVLRESGGLDALEKLHQAGRVRAVGISVKTVAGGMAAAGDPRCDVVMVTYNENEPEGAAVIRACAAAGKGVLVKKALASGHGVAAEGSAGAIRFALAEPGVGSVVVGTLNARHLAESVAAATSA